MSAQRSIRSACAYAQSDQSLYYSLGYSMFVNLLTEYHLEFLSLKGSCRGSSESTLVKISNCWKSHDTAHFISDSHVQREDSDAFQNISDDIEVEASYRGVHLTFPLTLNQLHKMVQAFRRKQVSNLKFFIFLS